MKSSNLTRYLVESSMMIALATVLSIFKIVEMPYGGSVTMASMLPMVILAYRHGVKRGIGAGVVYAALQQLLGLNTLSYVTTWQSILAVIMLDYIVAFTVVGFAGVFRKHARTQRSALAFGALLVTVLRYVCHVISGATVWAGLSIPDSAALIYSFGYNATYMLPEAIILISVAYYLGGVIDFSKPLPTRAVMEKHYTGDSSLALLSGLSFLLGGLVDVWLIAPCLQNEETGEFYFKGLLGADWISIGIVTVLSVVVGISFIFLSKRNKTEN